VPLLNPTPLDWSNPLTLGAMMKSAGAIFDNPKERTRRYLLWRQIKDSRWEKGHDFLMFIGLNPSIADEKRLDPTVTRCYNYAYRWGFGYLLMGNLYSKISTDPDNVDFDILDLVDQTENYWYLQKAMSLASMIVLCWGSNASDQIAGHFLRLTRMTISKSLYCLGTNANKSPKHPLYLRGDAVPQLFEVDLK